MTGVYKQSVAGHLKNALVILNNCRKTYEKLKDHESDYAREILALIRLHERVVEVWKTAPEEAPKETEVEDK